VIRVADCAGQSEPERKVGLTVGTGARVLGALVLGADVTGARIVGADVKPMSVYRKVSCHSDDDKSKYLHYLE